MPRNDDPPGTVRDGEFVPVPREGEHIACCDCGLTHLIKVVRHHGQLGLKFWRSPRETRIMRATMQHEEIIRSMDRANNFFKKQRRRSR